MREHFNKTEVPGSRLGRPPYCTMGRTPSFSSTEPLTGCTSDSCVCGFYHNPALPGGFGNLYALSMEY